MAILDPGFRPKKGLIPFSGPNVMWQMSRMVGADLSGVAHYGRFSDISDIFGFSNACRKRRSGCPETCPKCRKVPLETREMARKGTYFGPLGVWRRRDGALASSRGGGVRASGRSSTNPGEARSWQPASTIAAASAASSAAFHSSTSSSIER